VVLIIAVVVMAQHFPSFQKTWKQLKQHKITMVVLIIVVVIMVKHLSSFKKTRVMVVHIQVVEGRHMINSLIFEVMVVHILYFSFSCCFFELHIHLQIHQKTTEVQYTPIIRTSTT
jgi:hypothetical protein